MLNDSDEGVRLATFVAAHRQLFGSFFGLKAIVNADTFGDHPPAERRNIFHAMRATTGDEAVPYWTSLLTEWGWTKRKKRGELALMAIDALETGDFRRPGRPETGAQRHGGRKQACATTLAGVSKHSRTA
jgi:hypothetical protein